MKERTKGFVSGILAATLTLGLAGGALATVGNVTRELSYNNISVTLNGSEVKLADANGNAVEPFTIDGTTYLPVRAISNALGLGVSWDNSTSTVVLTSDSSTTSTPGATTSSYSRTNPAPVGTYQSVTVENYTGDYTATIAVLNTVRGNAAWALVKEANMFNSEAPEGKEYIVAKITVTINDVETDGSIYLSSYLFTPYSQSNVQYSSYAAVAPDPMFSGSVYKGGTLTGYAVYTVDQTDAAPKVVFGDNYDGTGGIWFSLT